MTTDARFLGGTVTPQAVNANGIWIAGGMDIVGTHVELLFSSAVLARFNH